MPKCKCKKCKKPKYILEKDLDFKLCIFYDKIQYREKCDKERQIKINLIFGILLILIIIILCITVKNN